MDWRRSRHKSRLPVALSGVALPLVLPGILVTPSRLVLFSKERLMRVPRQAEFGAAKMGKTSVQR